MYHCEYCVYECKDPSNMQRHIRGLHSSDRYNCQICSAEFKWISGLKKHMQNHYSQMKIVNQPLSRKDSLMSHINTIHNGEQIIPNTKYDLNVETF